jgi:hypothetical protein
MENFNRNKFQWVKTNDRARLGKVVTCVDIVPHGNTFVAKFDDSSSVDVRKITSDLLMITADMQPLSREEVLSINGPVQASAPSNGGGPIKLPPELQKEADAMRAEAAARPKIEPEITVSEITISSVEANRHSFSAAPQKSNMFSVFNSEETQISLNISVKLPDKKLLKMMYASAEDKDKFIGELSDFIMDQINKEVVSDSVINTIAPAPAKKAAKSE